MSKFADQLRTARIFNNYDLLGRFGVVEDACIMYKRAAAGRMGWTQRTGTSIWAVSKNPALDKPEGLSQTYCKFFYGIRSHSWTEAMAFAAKTWPDTKFVVSPFGGYLPKRVLDNARKYVGALQ